MKSVYYFAGALLLMIGFAQSPLATAADKEADQLPMPQVFVEGLGFGPEHSYEDIDVATESEIIEDLKHTLATQLEENFIIADVEIASNGRVYILRPKFKLKNEDTDTAQKAISGDSDSPYGLCSLLGLGYLGYLNHHGGKESTVSLDRLGAPRQTIQSENRINALVCQLAFSPREIQMISSMDDVMVTNGQAQMDLGIGGAIKDQDGRFIVTLFGTKVKRIIMKDDSSTAGVPTTIYPMPSEANARAE